MTAATTTATTTPTGYRSGTWTIDPAHTEVGFSVRHMMVSKVRGRFDSFAGTITTGDQVEDSGVEASIELGSISTGNAQRDEHVRSPDFFATDAHPAMTYRSTAVIATDDGWTVEGELSLKGITRSVPLAVELHGFGPDAYGGYRVGMTATARINRHDFDVSWNSAIEGGGVVVSDKVDIVLEIQAVHQG